MDWSVRDNSAQQRFEIVKGDALGGWVEYELRDDVITMRHTEVDSAYEGEGLGSTLTRGALDSARERRLSVIPTCPFVAGYIKRHAEYADLVPPVRRSEFGVG